MANTKATEPVKVKPKCTCCGSDRSTFYKSPSNLYENNGGRITVCNDCVKKIYEEYVKKTGDRVFPFKKICSIFGWYFSEQTFKSALVESDSGDRSPISIYVQRIFVGDCKWKTYDDNVFEEFETYAQSKNIVDNDENINLEEVELKYILENDYEKNKISVINSIGYDPFEFEPDTDKAMLYGMLVNSLDESTLEDSFKLPCVIQIVKNFSQIEHINRRINEIISNKGDTAELKKLNEIKRNLNSSTLAFAKENGISIVNSMSKSKGSGTLTGKIKELQEIGLEEVLVNVIDVETATAMKQVSDINSQSLIEKLRLDENEYTSIILGQRTIIEEKDKILQELEENCRLLRVKIAKIESGEIKIGGAKQ